MGNRTALAERIAGVRGGQGDARDMVGELRRALVLVPIDSGGLWTAELGGVRWICAFTDEAALARFALARETPGNAGNAGSGDAPGNGGTGREWEYSVLRGARLLDEIVPAMGVPAGVAVDIAEPDGAMFFPPVTGIVPDSVAVDAADVGVGGAAGAPARDGGVR
ncbi:hypothetical protein AB0A60_21655 [Streptomyces sp. NPDC046275]|uniref:hypothetical protein n=1 Tax=Streptomyces sp. NPDC046275 TaxID=3157201 RepID=UPI0034078725